MLAFLFDLLDLFSSLWLSSQKNGRGGGKSRRDRETVERLCGLLLLCGLMLTASLFIILMAGSFIFHSFNR